MGDKQISRGPGKLQRSVQKLITEDEHGAWSCFELCKIMYETQRPSKKHRVAVLRAIRRMNFETLPEHWTTWSGFIPGVGNVLYNRLSADSTAKKRWLAHFGPGRISYANFVDQYPHQIEEARKEVEEYRKFHESDEVGRLDIRIADLRKSLIIVSKFGVKDAATDLVRRIAALNNKRQELVAAAA